MSEQKIQTKILDWLHDNGFYAIKVVVASRSGTSDIVACSPRGRFVAIEVKKPGGMVSKLQTHNLEEIRLRKGIAFVAYDVDDVKQNLKGELNGSINSTANSTTRSGDSRDALL